MDFIKFDVEEWAERRQHQVSILNETADEIEKLKNREVQGEEKISHTSTPPFPRVLQGQEICSLRSFPQLAGFSLTAASENSNLGYTCPFAYTSQVSIHQRHKE
ncbi:hypothetical protein YC2023_021802 [Brassica napus]